MLKFMKRYALLGWIVSLPVSASLVGYGVCSLINHHTIEDVVNASRIKVDRAQQRVIDAKDSVDKLKQQLAHDKAS